MIYEDFPNETALRLTYDELKRAYPNNRLLWAMAQANLRFRPEYKCLIEGKAVVVVPPEVKT